MTLFSAIDVVNGGELSPEYPQYCWEFHDQLWLVNEEATSRKRKGPSRTGVPSSSKWLHATFLFSGINFLKIPITITLFNP